LNKRNRILNDDKTRLKHRQTENIYEKHIFIKISKIIKFAYIETVAAVVVLQTKHLLNKLFNFGIISKFLNQRITWWLACSV